MSQPYVHERETCPCCGWTGRSFKLPAHILDQHLDKIHLYQTSSPHCIFASVMDGSHEKEFCVCLTCKRGSYHGNTEEHGSRWVARHSKEAKCKAAHKEALAALRTQLYASTPDVSNNTPDSMAVLWGECKANSSIRSMTDEVERACRENSDGNEPSAWFRQSLYSATGYKRRVDNLEKNFNSFRSSVEVELAGQRRDIFYLQQDNDRLRANDADKSEKLALMSARIDELNRINSAYKKENDELRQGNSE